MLMLAVFAGMCFAQVSGYVFSYSAGIYTEITGGTVLGTAAVGGGANNSLDSNVYQATPISFPFHYNGLPYNEVAVGCDGWILLGGSVSVAYTPISNTAANEGVIAALGRDIIGITDAGSLGEIRYQTLGESPNRVFVVQWKNFRSYYTSVENYNFQIRLHENSDIEIVYGPMMVNPPYNPTCQVGLRGAFNTDFNNRTTTTDWAASTQGTINTASMALNSSCYPANGTTFLYTLTVTAPPNPTVQVYPADNGYIFLDGAIKWNNSGGYPSSFQVHFGTSTPPPLVTELTSLSYSPVLAANTTYYWRIDAVNAFGTTEGSVRSFKTPTTTQLVESFENTLFPPVGWYNPNTWSRSTSTPFHLTAVAYKSANTTPAILSTPKVTITPTSVLDFYYKPGSTTGYGRLQIVYSTDRVTWTALGSEITMPLVSAWNNAIVNLGSISGNYFLGFKVYTNTSSAGIYIDHVFGPEIANEAPGPVTLTSPADAAVDVNPRPIFSWSAPTLGGVPMGYKVYCDTNTDPVTLLGTTPDLTFTTPSALNYGTTYYWKVVVYNGTGESTSNPVRSFTVWNDPTIHAFPWSESFDGTTFAPIGWENFKTAGTSSPGIWNRSTSGTSPTCTTHSGAGMARYNSSSIQTGGRAELVTPPLSIPNNATYKVKFWMYRDSGYATKTQEVVNLYVNTSANSTGGTLIGTISRYYGFAPVEATANQWYQYTFTFTGAASSVYLVFEGVSEYGNNMFIDDISVQAIAPPAAPTLTYPANYATGLPQAGFNLTWSPDLVNGDAPAYYVLYVASSEETIYDEYVYDNLTVTSFNPATAALDPLTYAYGTQYYWTVQAINTSGDAIADPVYRFTIENLPLVAPELTISVSVTGTADISWAAVTNANSYKVYGTIDPFSVAPWELLTTTGDLTYTYTGTEPYKFFKVIASTELP